jgi:hypothetical protein
VAVYFRTVNPRKLLADFKSAIAGGQIKTWSVDADGDFTHAAEQWRYKAWFRPRVTSEELQLFILPPRGKTISKAVYAVYHGRFIEAILTHFDQQISRAISSALPEGSDSVRSSL